MTIEQQMDRNEKRHYAADDRFMDKLDRAHELIGRLCREGNTVYYINLRNGKTREGQPSELSDFLIRNRYV
jgi:hypothetical protein